MTVLWLNFEKTIMNVFTRHFPADLFYEALVNLYDHFKHNLTFLTGYPGQSELKQEYPEEVVLWHVSIRRN